MSKSLKELYDEVNIYLKKVNFNNIWNGFKPLKFALYNDKECYFDGSYIDKTNLFLGNTAINYNGQMIAIWNVMEEINPIILTSKMAHEMFHGYQNLNDEKRFPNEMHAIYNYQYSDRNLSIKLIENKLINELNEEFNLDKYQKLLGLRKYRYNHFKYEFLYESRIEQVEGTANYVELNVLKELSMDLYNKKLLEMKEFIIKEENLLPVRIVSYDIGALLLNILNSNNISFNREFNDITISEELIKDVIEYYTDYISLEDEIYNYHLRSKCIIDKALLDNEVIFEGSEKLLAFNVYNARYYDNYIISRYFVMYGNEDNPLVKYGDFAIKTSIEGIIDKIYNIK